MLRRRSPGWIRSMESRNLHALALRLRNQEHQGYPLTPGQEWLWRAAISELEYRNRQLGGTRLRCTCELCSQPGQPELDADLVP